MAHCTCTVCLSTHHVNVLNMYLQTNRSTILRRNVYNIALLMNVFQNVLRHHCRWRAANGSPCSALMAIDRGGNGDYPRSKFAYI